MSLTKYQEGGIRELWALSVPLMLSSLSVMLMLFVDRLLLAHYSTGAMNAAVNASTLGWAFVFGWVVLCNISEVFVAQYNGAKQYDKLGEPVWQLLWLALISTLFFIPMSIWGGDLIYSDPDSQQMERGYIRWMMLFGPSFAAFGALTGFFVGQGKTLLITLLALGANLLNALLDFLFIFGIPNVLPSMGVEGAAIATGIGSCFEMAVLFYFFLKKENRDKYGTGRYAFSPQSFFQCIKIGLPGALFTLVEILGWATFYWMMTLVSEIHITVAGICQSFFMLLLFFSDGVSKAATAIAGNLIGAKKQQFIKNLIWSGFVINLAFSCCSIIAFLTWHELLIDQFLPHVTPEFLETIETPLMTSLIITLIYTFFESIRWLYSGILTAAGDTTFLLISGSLSVWVLLIAPVYYFVVRGTATVDTAILFWLIFSICATLIYFLRFQRGSWKSQALIKPLA